MKWEHPPVIKIYEALGSVADERLEMNGNSCKVYSSTGNKFYDVTYDPDKRAIMSNDNASYWKGYCGYPSIAFLMKAGVVSYDENIARMLKGIAWKDINQKFKNDFDKTLEFILADKTDEDKKVLNEFVLKVDQELKDLNLQMLGTKVKPPAGY